ncbi:Epimerase domain-containing protein [Lachancea thermotolerans]
MKVLITGGSGFIGSGVVSELLSSDHAVIALARSEEPARKLRSLGFGVEVLYGDLKDLESPRKGAVLSEGIIHLGFIHNFNNFSEFCAIDQKAVVCMLDSIQGTNKPFIYPNGTLWLPQGRVCDENERRNPEVHSVRALTEDLFLNSQYKGSKAIVVRLGASVHDKEDHGFVPILAQIAKSSRKSAYIGSGQNVWPAVHRLDAAVLFRLALEHGSAGKIYHAVAESVAFKSIAHGIAKGLNVPAVSVPLEEWPEQFKFVRL